ncbi:MAG: hypothetical protein HWN65_19265 [Candidatus Helarchaeota archaeon]|nr:hypothetical protein [Candidatus Helarchaeota archaeon]
MVDVPIVTSGIILYYDGIDVGVIVARLHQFLLNPRFPVEKELIPLALDPIINGEDFV